MLPVLRHPARVSAACARLRAQASAVCPAVAVLPPAAVGSASDVRVQPPAVAALRASRVLLRAAPAVPVSAMVPAWRAQPQVARAVQARLPAAA
ncbi:hypothetical protein FNJ47_31800 [Bradyrhizobium sp. UFLA 03-164]|uniref:Uncharacterized protein n=1 Tax=Bradyrhizobium uaiense TaxID=2594946 RepID=A0A6P1BP43_9BRAD|nr:hypothetical protein [Bradyrhizobium uaiense]